MSVVGLSRHTSMFIRRSAPLTKGSTMQPQRTAMFAFLDQVWNRVDRDRIKEIGPEKAAAEWLIKNGAAVRWKNQAKFVSDYNSMEVTTRPGDTIEAIDATEASIMGEGFEYLQGLSSLRMIRFNKTHHISDGALRKLSYVKDTLEEVEVMHCGNVTDAGVKSLGQLPKLKNVMLADLIGVKNLEQCAHSIKSDLPECEVQVRPTT
ncbi:hypothetical protein RvY_05451 [Ramazzottius varieornatus]|uniref:Uncharacterized protein n=1 Tax=Ramazzottius varieornatus TaxID=947166 RepID=A0A1D1UYP0_RAMVA|nr:hypothetical protein RvY_05451 [Ramazzottius varieornatus]